jgi:FkbH-like protein
MHEPQPAAALQSDVRTPSHVRAKAQWRAFQAQAAPENQHRVSIGLSASFTADSLVPMLGAALLEKSFTPDIRLGQYNQVFQTCLNHRSQFEIDPDVIVLLWRIEDLLGQEFEQFIFGNAGALDAAASKVDELARSIKQLRQAFKGTIIVSLPPFPHGTPVDLLDLDTPVNAGRFHRAILDYAFQELSSVGQIRFLDFDAVQRYFGFTAAFDARKWYLYKQPYTEPFLWELGLVTARLVRASRMASRKCAVLDCDNTIWGGIVGEDGVEGVSIGEDFPGSAYSDLQKLLLYWRSRGVLLALASKNNEPDVWEVFEQRADNMPLKRDHISAWRINWNNKVSNIQQIADELNIGVDSLVFIDDNPFEIGQVQKLHPELTSIVLDEEPARMLESLKRARPFEILDVTEEDVKRADMIRSEHQRVNLEQSLCEEDFIKALDLKILFGIADRNQLGRVAQLINKTNQFNLTTVRRSLEQVQELHTSPDWRLYVLTVTDRFGEYGLVGIAVVETGLKDRWRIDSFLMSCRVLGRGVETSFLAGIACDAGEAGKAILEAAFIPTAKNAPAAKFLPDHHFAPIDEHRWQIAVRDVPPIPVHVNFVRANRQTS